MRTAISVNNLQFLSQVSYSDALFLGRRERIVFQVHEPKQERFRILLNRLAIESPKHL